MVAEDPDVIEKLRVQVREETKQKKESSNIVTSTPMLLRQS
jgi:hypothetical protein